MLLGRDYYLGIQDILERERMVIDEYGKLVAVDNLPNNRIVDNQYAKLVDQKTNYALGKPMTIATSNETYLEELHKIFDRKTHLLMRLLGEEAILGGISWLYPYYNELGEFKLKVFPSYEVMPIWTDNSHTELTKAVRIYSDVILQSNGKLKDVTILEFYSENGIDRFVLEGHNLKPHPAEPHIDYMRF